MNKRTLLFLVFIALTQVAFAQDKNVRLGLRFAPNISFNGAEGEGNYKDISNDGAGLRLSGGLITDFFFAENYAFSTGLWYTIKRSAFKNMYFATTREPNDPIIPTKSNYNLQYLQIPISLKLYTNEVATDIKVYFQVGGTLDIKLAEKPKDKSNNILYYYSEVQNKAAYLPVGAGLLFGAGAEVQMGENTLLFGGLSFNRSLVNPINPNLKDINGDKFRSEVKSLNSYLALEMGLKF